jgi:maleylacetoacetate isomerase
VPKLELYTYWRSSSAYRVRIALGYKGLAYEPRFVNLLQKEQLRPEYLAKNPAGYVPALVVDGEVFTESVAILELLDDLFPQKPLYPKEPYARARVRALVETIASGTQPLQNVSVLERVSADTDVRKQWLQHFIGRGLRTFDALMASHEAHGVKGPYAFGESFGAADCALVPQVYAAKRFSVDLSGVPRVVAAHDAAMKLDFVQRASPERQPDAKT